ncbi:hypothetical protein [Calycomorphotria hydatis]|nr:hypothetical protein [Calycomorphotria hydatis]
MFAASRHAEWLAVRFGGDVNKLFPECIPRQAGYYAFESLFLQPEAGDRRRGTLKFFSRKIKILEKVQTISAFTAFNTV